MARLRCTESGAGVGVETGTATMGSYVLYRDVHTALRQGQEPDPLSLVVLVSCCAGPIPCPSPPSMQREQAITWT